MEEPTGDCIDVVQEAVVNHDPDVVATATRKRRSRNNSQMSRRRSPRGTEIGRAHV